MYDLLVQAGKDTPVVGNQDGSYVTMKSNQGLVFGAATILSGTYLVAQGLPAMLPNLRPQASREYSVIKVRSFHRLSPSSTLT